MTVSFPRPPDATDSYIEPPSCPASIRLVDQGRGFFGPNHISLWFLLTGRAA